ncbi:FkbM family methyltransferase [Tepidamorphus sp. 3E244]|uniref:FkbM family methyltransferase n=1 Tax=Tepidamorphus sp. 3E244 TaxID=3385498 RepID=UPI0038FD25DD
MFRKIARACGYDAFRLERQARIETHLAALLPMLQVDVVVDAGANAGQFGQKLRALGYKGDIVSYEPLSAVFPELQEAAATDMRWHTRNKALGTQAGTATIRQSPDSTWSSLKGFSDYGKRRFTEQDRDAVAEQIEVARLDADLPELLGDDPRRVYLKMDTQGFDLEVFEGARGLMHEVVGLQAEVAFQNIYDGVPGYRQTLETFEEAGFAVTGMFPVKRDRKSLRMIEMDCVMRRIDLD